MPSVLASFRRELRSHANPAKAAVLSKFFKTAKGQYGHGDQFLGLTVPTQRRIVTQFEQQLTVSDIKTLLNSPIHEERLCAVLALVAQFKKARGPKRSQIYQFYLKNARRINNWDLVDASAHHIVGAYLDGKNVEVLFRLAESKILWERRIAMVATWHDIRLGRHESALAVALRLLQDEHDLIHKAVGWMLREVGKHCSVVILEDFVARNFHRMPRTSLRYAIERLPAHRKKGYMTAKGPLDKPAL